MSDRLGRSLFRLSDESGDAPYRIVCLPFAGGTLRYFQTWPDYLGRDWDTLGVMQAGRDARLREEPLESIGAMARQAADDLKALVDRPYIMFGHSIGGVIAYETVRELTHQGIPKPHALCIASTPAPHLFFNEDLDESSDEKFKDRLRILGMDMTLFSRHPKAMATLWPGIRADFMAGDKYQPDTPDRRRLSVPIMTWAGTEDPFITTDAVQLWKDYTTTSFQLTAVPASHSYMEEETDRILPQIAELMTVETKG